MAAFASTHSFKLLNKILINKILMKSNWLVSQNVVELLDDLFHRAAAANEPEELNFVRKHAQSMQAKVCA